MKLANIDPKLVEAIENGAEYVVIVNMEEAIVTAVNGSRGSIMTLMCALFESLADSGVPEHIVKTMVHHAMLRAFEGSQSKDPESDILQLLAMLTRGENTVH